MIRTEKLTKVYGANRALDGIDLNVNEGDIYGFVGPNGAGKTTTIRVLTTLLEPTSGTATVNGYSIWGDADKIRRCIGYMPDNFGVYRDMTVTEYLHFFASAYGVPHKARKDLVSGLLELVGLTHKAESLIDALSRGMQQRLGIARTLVHDPKVLVLDEPASGLDPRARVEMREILKELQAMGKTILLSSHILPELQALCTRVGILANGKIAAEGTLTEVIAQSGHPTEVLVRTDDDARAESVLRELRTVLGITASPGGLVVQVEPQAELAELAAKVVGRGLGLRHLELREPNLEQIFMRLTQAVG